MTTYDDVAKAYELGRIGYSNDLYNTLIGYGLTPSMRVLDVGCGTGLASEPLIENGFNVVGLDSSAAMLEIAKKNLPSGKWVLGKSESLPFEPGSFDFVVSAQAFHHFDRAASLREIVRVLRPGGIMAIWWKRMLGDDAIKRLRDEIVRGLGAEPFESGLSGGFKEFYALSPVDQTLRVVPWNPYVALGKFMQYERSRKIVHDRLGGRAEQYYAQLETRLHETFGPGDPHLPLAYMHYLYLGKTP